MDARPDKTRKSKEEDRRMMIKKHFVDKQKKGPVPSLKSDGKISESSKEVPDSDEKPPVNNSEKRPDSPEPNCAICLEPLTNKSFTDSCFHTFCFTCLVEWSKVKPECPLCKQQFKSIVHNVQSDFSYDEYHISSRTTNLMWNYLAAEPRFRYPTTMAPITFFRREPYQENYHSQIESHRMRYAPHAVRMFSGTHLLSSEPCRFRIRVYEHGLWVRPAVENRVRTVTPEFLRQNPACTHRLLPWLNRELVALLQNNETQVTFVLELIMALIARYEMNSQEFFIHIEPYLGDKTRHFIHELHNFAISPHDMEAYDRHSDYTGPTDNLFFQEDNSEVSIVNDLILNIPSAFRSSAQNAAAEEKNLQIAKTLKKIVIKKNADNNWETVTVPSYETVLNPGPSTSSSAYFLDSPSASTVDEDEECQVLKVLKSKGERTPEIVDLSSDEEVMQTVINIPSDSDNSSSDSPQRFEFSPWRMIPRLLPTRKRSPLRCRFTAGASPPSSVSWSTKYPPTPDEYHSPSFMDSDGSSTDIECVYTSEQASTSTAKPAVVRNVEKDAEKDSTIKSPTITTELTISNVQDLNKHEPKKKLSSAIVRPWAMAVQTTPQESLPKPSKAKRHAPSLHLDDVSSSSENATSDNRSPKKLKLRSVVAHFSFDSSEKRHDSSHRPSHKKHKDKKKKKKKKHLHKHKHRIYSDSDSS